MMIWAVALMESCSASLSMNGRAGVGWARLVGRWPWAQAWCNPLPGRALRVVARALADFERVLRRRIMTLPGVGDVEANVLLSDERRPGPI